MLNESQESNIILQGVLLTGIKNITFNSSVTEGSTKLLANKGINRKIYGPPQTTCSFSKPYNGKDFIQTLTGVTNLSGQFIYKNDAIDFTDAVISNYGFNLNEDGFAEVNVTLQIFGDTKPTTNLKLLNSIDDFPIINKTPDITHFIVDGINSPFKKLNYEASFSPQSSNNIGSINASNINFTSPTAHKISVDIEMLDQEIQDITGFVDQNKLKKDITIIFGDNADKSKIDQILSIQSLVKEFENQGHKIDDDLDFSFGACAFNPFQFDEATISQNLNSKAGERIKLTNNYTAYTNTNKVEKLIPPPNGYISCEEQILKVRDNFNTLLGRMEDALFGDEIDFENHSIGVTGLTDLITYFNLTDFEGQPIEETGLLRIIANAIDFEPQSEGEYTRHILDFDAFSTKEDFELFTANEETQINIVNVDSFDMKEDFESSVFPVNQETQLNINFYDAFNLIEYFEGFEADEETQLNIKNFDAFTSTEDFENFVVDTTDNQAEIGDVRFDFLIQAFDQLEDFEGFVEGQIEVGDILDPFIILPPVPQLFFNETDFEGEPLQTFGLTRIFPVRDFFNEEDFQASPDLGTFELDQLFDGSFFDNETDFEGQQDGTVNLTQLLDDSFFGNVINFEDQTIQEISVNLYYLKI